MSFPPISTATQGTSTRPYLVRALYEWCTDNGFTPYVAVFVDANVQVPMDYVKNNEIVLNIGLEATSGLKLGNEFLEFKARFGGVSRDIMVPTTHVIAIYARENGQGMAFPMPLENKINNSSLSGSADGVNIAPAAREGHLSLADVNLPQNGQGDPDSPPSPPGGWPSLRRVK